MVTPVKAIKMGVGVIKNRITIYVMQFKFSIGRSMQFF